MDTVRCEVMQRKWYGYSASENKINMSAIILQGVRLALRLESLLRDPSSLLAL